MSEPFTQAEWDFWNAATEAQRFRAWTEAKTALAAKCAEVEALRADAERWRFTLAYARRIDLLGLSLTSAESITARVDIMRKRVLDDAAREGK